MAEKESNPIIYDMVVRCKIDDNEENFYFDYVEDNSTTLTSDICTHPLVTGDIMADHMYVNPANVSFNGTFSLLGNKKADKEYNFGSLDRLSNIQEMFERIMKEGIMCTLVKMGSNGDESRFKVRKNMVLTSITWTERQTSIDFNFSFTEALTAIVIDEPYEVDILDESLPVQSDPLSLNVTDELLNSNDIIQYTIAVLQENGLFAENFLEDAINSAVSAANWVGERLKGAAAGALVGAVGGSVAAASAITTMAVIFGGCASIPGPGWIAAGVIAAAAVVAGVIYGIWKTWKNSKYKIKQFKYYKKESKREKERERFYEFIGQITLQFEQLGERMSLYGFGQNASQECFVNIDNNQYIFTFSKSTAGSNYSLNIVDIGNKNIANITNIAEKSITQLGECNKDVLLFNTPSGCQVYLANREVCGKRQEGASNEEIESLQKDLTKYAILSSTLDLTKFKDAMMDIIKSQVFN